MPKFRKRPVVVEAFQHFGDMGTYTAEIPQWAIQAALDGIIYAYGKETMIKTLEGDMLVSDGDWIIKEPYPTSDRKIYPCKPDIFAKTYEPVEEDSDA